MRAADINMSETSSINQTESSIDNDNTIRALIEGHSGVDR